MGKVSLILLEGVGWDAVLCIHPTHHFAVGSRWSVQRGLSGPFFTVDSRRDCFDAGR